MKIYIDINHPAHVHYFRNFIKIMESKGHAFVITNRDSKIINELLDAYNIKHCTRNSRPIKRSTVKSIFYLLGIIYKASQISFKYKPNIYMGFASFPSTLIAFFFRKPCILMDDTEHNKKNHLLLKPFSPNILVPYYFNLNLGKNQRRFNSFVEYLYLHPDYFSPNKNILEKYKLIEKEYVIVRYITYDAAHDSKVKPVSEPIKKQLIQELAKHFRVLLFHENTEVEEFYKPYLLSIKPEELHHIMAYAAFCLTEGATMACEAGLMGIPYIYMNPLNVTNIEEQINLHPDLAISCSDENVIMDVLQKKIKSLKEDNFQNEIKVITSKIINPTKLLVWFIENYPRSKYIMQDNPDFQYQFK